MDKTLAIALVNEQAAKISEIIYPDWAGRQGVSWRVTDKLGLDDEGYQIFRIERGDDESIEIPANRLIAMSELINRLV